MGRKNQELTTEEKKERKHLANLKYYKNKGKSIYKASYEPKMKSSNALKIKESDNKLHIMVAMSNNHINEIKEFVINLQQSENI